MIVKAPTRAEKRPTQPRPQVDLRIAEIILGNPQAMYQQIGGLMHTWAVMQKEKANDRS